MRPLGGSRNKIISIKCWLNLLIDWMCDKCSLISNETCCRPQLRVEHEGYKLNGEMGKYFNKTEKI